MEGETGVVNFAAAGQVLRTQGLAVPVWPESAQPLVGRFPANHQLHQRGWGELGGRLRAHMAAVAQHAHSIAQGKDLFELVGDVDDRHALRFEPQEDPLQLARFVFGQRAGRLVEQQDAGVGGEGLGDLNQAAFARR